MERVKARESEEEKLNAIFDKLDNEGSEFQDLIKISTLLEKFKDGMYKEEVKEGNIF